MGTRQRTVAFCALMLGAAYVVGCEAPPRDRLAALGVAPTAEALVESAKTGHPETAQLLIDAGVDADASGADGVTALAWAVARDDAATVRVLTGAGADVAVAAGNDGMTVLMLAAQRGVLDVVQALVEAGAAVDVQDGFGNTALMQAVAEGRREVAAYLLAQGADSDRQTAGGASALGLAAVRGDADMVAVLLAGGASTEVREASFRMTPLAVAAFKGHLAVVQQLVEAGADITAVDRDGQTPILIAAAHGNEPVRALLARAAPPPVAHDGRGLFRRAAAFQPPPGWVLADPFTDQTPFFLSAGRFSTKRNPAGTQRALVRAPNEIGAQAFLIRGPVAEWDARLDAEVAELTSHPLVTEQPPRDVRTADGVALSVRVFRMLPGLISGADTTYVLGRAAVGDEVLVIDGGGPTETFPLRVVLDVVTGLDLARDLGMSSGARDARAGRTRPTS